VRLSNDDKRELWKSTLELHLELKHQAALKDMELDYRVFKLRQDIIFLAVACFILAFMLKRLIRYWKYSV
jgi:hypothetical protein